ncbi:Glu/Leu/Phe/Val dehydrogenase [Dysosmobacter sp. NSJ-60]|uniref:Glutamate dehydrogenase n=1 Tax=Pusillibacter faecalis TaxID=2714358 RepID=A0A810QDN1_9FIRM|nr:Glu/Leu/Phe/Val dehydrogenase [Pusillibacter faecalis]MBC5746298.1 Glu/Leu/Phe/Val dehydrogenase [Dysosmobacter hominis]BCK83976.1 glutamate dehydrogenase [Pusillibacter faecalis]
MSGNPFETSLKTLHEAAAIGQINAEVVRLLEQPKRQFEFTIPVRMDDGHLEIFQAFRVHYCDALGQVKNGVRVVPDMDMDTAKALGFWMTIKHAVGGIPAGGGKGGIKADPSKLSRREYEALIRGFIRYLPMKGTWVDVPGADIGTHGQTQSWMLDELEAIQGFHSPAAINDKPIEANGTELSREATGTGAFFVTREVTRDLGIPDAASFAVQGYGNVGRVAAELLCQRGHKLVAVSDIFGGIENQDGIDVNALGAYVDEYKTVKGFPGCRDITPSELLEVPCDILLPAAVQSVIHEGNAGKIQAKLIMECANGPTTPEAEKILESRGVIIVPDVLVNCGSAIVCSFERTQGLTDSYWDRETVRSRLEERIVKAYQQTAAVAKELGVSYRDAAWVNALRKIEKAMLVRGWAWDQPK